MEIYLVGGAVRDQLLGLPIKERDWVVVGATPEEMIARGFRKVGRDFPVFLHPQTNEEYALARTERKSGKGYTEFICYSDPSVTLEEDLKRRDLTINAIAQALDGKIIDPYCGQKDLENKILRHVSAAFVEDPVRILRVARFASRFSDFKIHSETLQLMHQMLINGEVDALVPERVWREFSTALNEKASYRFFEALYDCQLIKKLFPEISAHFVNIIAILRQAEQKNFAAIERFTVMASCLTEEEIVVLCERLRAPKDYKELAFMAAANKNICLNALRLNADELVGVLEKLDAYRRPERFERFLVASAVGNDPECILYLQNAHQKTKMVHLTKEIIESKVGKEIATELHKERVKKLL